MDIDTNFFLVIIIILLIIISILLFLIIKETKHYFNRYDWSLAFPELQEIHQIRGQLLGRRGRIRGLFNTLFANSFKQILYDFFHR